MWPASGVLIQFETLHEMVRLLRSHVISMYMCIWPHTCGQPLMHGGILLRTSATPTFTCSFGFNLSQNLTMHLRPAAHAARM